MKLSIITFTYNQKKTLPALYNSLLAQKEYIHEWIIRDDGSTDGTQDMIRSFMDSGKIKIIPMFRVNGGKKLALYFNECLKEVTGDLVMQVFGDTFLGEGSLKKLFESYIPNTAGCAYEYEVDEKDHVIKNDYRMNYEERDDVSCTMHVPNPWTALTGSGLIAETEALRLVGGEDEEFSGYGVDDTDLFMRLMMNGIKLYLYNNVKVYHHFHGNEEDNKENRTLYYNKIEGSNYECGAKTIVFDADDFSLENNNVYYLEQIKEHLPNFKISLFTIPFDYRYYKRIQDFQRDQMKEWIRKNSDWVELIPHGLTHSPREFETASKEAMESSIHAIEKVFTDYKLPYVKGFKAPFWLYTQETVDYLDSIGWWMATDRNQPLAPKTKRYFEYTHSIDEPFWLSRQETIYLHSHISLPSSNNIPDNLFNILKISPTATFKFISEVV